ncbi:PLC-like phosphodiesterase [Clavulina sp. PMI_390]|nr:PLC-like phosphodiesterase [Clavulina sp. PMI_390]
MSLQTYFQTSLPDCGYQLTSTLVSGKNIYAASNGYVYLLDFVTGAVLQQNNLSGRGHKEVRIAISDDGSTLVVGTDGYILGLNSSTLSTNWETSLPKCGYNLVNVVAAGGGGTGYAACNGYVYSYNISNGAIQATNSLSGRGEHETRIALTLASDVLLVGIDGYALGLNPSSLGTNWQTSLPGCGYFVTSVVGGESCCYAGCNGYLYMLNAFSGTITNQNNMEGTGKAECHLVLRQDAGVLFVGVNGYAVATKSSDISSIYTTSLPDCGFNITDVAAGVLYTYFGCNGYVYGLDDQGNVQATNVLPGLGYHETRLAVNAQARERVFVGIYGYSVGLDPVPLTPAGPWMSNSAAILGPKMLRQIAIPGTHDSGTYAIFALAPIGQDLPWYVKLIQAVPLPSIVIRHIIALWSIAQPADFLTQLNAGVRYFDLRVQGPVSGGPAAFVHGLVSAPVSDLVHQLTVFLSTPGYANEVVILDFNHFYAMSRTDHDALIENLTFNFFGALAIYNPKGSNKGGDDGFNTNVTLNDLWATNARIIVYYADDVSVANNNVLWPNVGNNNVAPAITSPWPDKANYADLKVALDQELPYTGTIPFVLQSIVTPDASTILSALAGSTVNSLGALAEVGKLQISQWLNGWGPNVGINIVIADWITENPYFISTILALNGTKAAVASEEEAIATLATVPKSPLTPDDLVKGIQNGTIKLADIIHHTHTQAFRVFGRNPSKENVKALTELQEFVEGSEVGKSKLVNKADVEVDPKKSERKEAVKE